MIGHFTQSFGGNIEVVLVEEATPKNGTKAADWTDCALIVKQFIQLHLTYHKPPLEKDYQGPQRTEQQT